MPHPKHTNVLLDICHHHTDSYLLSKVFFKVDFKLNNGTFQIINHLKNLAILLKITVWNIDKKKTITISSYSYFLFVYVFTLILKMQWNIQQYYPSFYTFYESHFYRVRHPSHPGRGHGSLTCHITQCERSDRLRSENFINIIIESVFKYVIESERCRMLFNCRSFFKLTFLKANSSSNETACHKNDININSCFNI